MFDYLCKIFSAFMFFVMHVTGAGSFPKALSKKDEEKYLLLMQDGDINARKKLIEHNLRLVAHVIKKYYTQDREQDDLISIGTIGLIKAVDSFKPNKGIKLSSYASRCVENEVLMHFRASKKTAQDVSINEPIEMDKNGNALTIMDTMSTGSDIIDEIDSKMKCEKLYVFLENLKDKREKEIVILRYGLYGKKPLTQKAVSEKLKISRSYVSRIEKKALENLKKNFE